MKRGLPRGRTVVRGNRPRLSLPDSGSGCQKCRNDPGPVQDALSLRNWHRRDPPDPYTRISIVPHGMAGIQRRDYGCSRRSREARARSGAGRFASGVVLDQAIGRSQKFFSLATNSSSRCEKSNARTWHGVYTRRWSLDLEEFDHAHRESSAFVENRPELVVAGFLSVVDSRWPTGKGRRCQTVACSQCRGSPRLSWDVSCSPASGFPTTSAVMAAMAWGRFTTIARGRLPPSNTSWGRRVARQEHRDHHTHHQWR